MTDHYATLGVDRNADTETIKRAYRKLAAKHHPDRGGDTGVFQSVQAAYETLSDPGKRAAYDRPQPQGFNFHYQNGDGVGGMHDFFSQMFGGGSPFGQQGFKPQTRMSLWIQLSDVASGGRRPVSIGTHAGVTTVEIDIPMGIEDGATVQYSGIAPGGGDLLITFRVHPHPVWSRNGNDLHVEHTVSMWDCILGGETEIRDILGTIIKVTIPQRCQPGTTLRLKERGLRTRNSTVAGDILVKIQAKIPNNIPEELIESITTLRGEHKC